MDEKAQLLLTQIEKVLKDSLLSKKDKQARQCAWVLQGVQVLLTACEAKLFSRDCMRGLLEGIERILCEKALVAIHPNLVRSCASQAAKVARNQLSFDLGRRFTALLGDNLESEAEGPESKMPVEEEIASPRGMAWHTPYTKVLLRLYEYYQDNPEGQKKLAFSDVLQEALKTFLGLVKESQTSLDAGTRTAIVTLIQDMAQKNRLDVIATEAQALSVSPAFLMLQGKPKSPLECRLPLLLLSFFQEAVLSKEKAQKLLSLIQSFADVCLQIRSKSSNAEAYGLFDKAIILADHFNLATHKVALVLAQGKIFGGGQATHQIEEIPADKIKMLLDNYFDALPLAEEKGDVEPLHKLSQAITILEKRFLYQTVAPWVTISMAQAIESDNPEVLAIQWRRFEGLSQALLSCNLPELAWDCLYACQLALTGRLKGLHGAAFEALVSASSVASNASSSFAVVGEWQQSRQQLAGYRKILQRGIQEPTHFLDSQVAYTDNMLGLMVKFFREAEAWLGTPPEPYAILGLGSISRKTMSPYSDFECVFLVTNPESANWEELPTEGSRYFDALYQLFEFKMASLGEIRGFRLDKEGHPRKELRLRGTVDAVIKACKPPLVPIDDAMTYSLVQPCLVHGDEGLWQEYQEQFKAALAQPVFKKDDTPWGVLLAKRFAQFHIKALLPASEANLAKKSKKEEESEKVGLGINVKKRYVSELFYLLGDLCLSEQWFFTYPSEMLTRLVAENLLPAVFANAYRGAMQWADRIRVRLHLHYKEQKDEAWLPGDPMPARSEGASIFLTAQEVNALQCIEWGILQPMRQAVLRWCKEAGTVEALRSPVQALLSMTLLQSQEAFSNRPIFTGVQRDVMRSLIAMLWLAEATPAQYRMEFLHLPNLAIRQLFLTQLRLFQGQYDATVFEMIENALEDAPYRDGSRDNEYLRQETFDNELAALVVEDSKTPGPLLEWIGIDGQRHTGALHPKVVEALQQGKLLDSKGKFQLSEKLVYLPGRHLVFGFSVQIGETKVAMHIKFFPEMPGMEYAAGSLARLLVGWGAPYVQLARFVEGTKIYPILLSQTVPGELLSDVLKQSGANELHACLAPQAFSQRVLLSLLLNQEDAKPSNFIAVAKPLAAGEKQYSLVCIDNDRSFFQAVMEENGQVVPIVKDITYCFETMNEPLHPLVCVDVTFMDPFLLLKKWLENLDNFNRHLKLLFSEKEVEKYFPKSPNAQRLQQLKQNVTAKDAVKVKESILPIVLREQVAAELFGKLIRIQRYLGKHAEATGQQLLRHVEPYLSKYYGNLFKYYPQIDARFQQGFAKLYSEKKDKRGTQQTLKTTFATLQTFHGKPVDSGAFLARRDYSIQDAINELTCARDSQKAWEIIFEQLQKGQENGIKEFVRMRDADLAGKIVSQLDFAKVPATFEQAFWTAILPLEIAFKKLILKNSRITLTQFEQLLKPMKNLKLLTLENCSALGDQAVTLIAQYCPIVERLWLIRLPLNMVDNRQSFIRQLFTPLGARPAGVFDELRSLSIQACGTLSELYVQAPALTHLEIQQCPKFLKGTLNSVVLREVKIINAPLLTQGALSKLVQQAGRLKVFELTQCPLLKALPFYQQFPYLLPLDVTLFSEGWLTRFMKLLAPYEPRKLTEEQVSALVSALKTYFSYLERLKEVLLALIKNEKDESRDVRMSALLSLGQLGYLDESVCQMLSNQANHTNISLRQAVQIALLTLQGEKATPETIAAVETATQSADPLIAQAALRALIVLPAFTEKVAGALLLMLPNSISDVRKATSILFTLSQIGRPLAAVISGLESLLVAMHPAIIQANALYALSQIGVFDATFTQHSDYFQALGRDPFRYAAILAELLQWDTAMARHFQLVMLPYAKSLLLTTLPADLLKQVKDSRWDQRKQAVMQVRDLKIDTKEVRGLLYEAARDLSHQVRQMAIEALADLPQPDTLTGPALAQALQDKERLVCEAGLQGLARHTELANATLFPTLQALMSGDSAISTRKRVAQTLSYWPARLNQAFDLLLLLVSKDIYTEVKQTAMESSLHWLSFNSLGVYLDELCLLKKEEAEKAAVKAEKKEEMREARQSLPMPQKVMPSDVGSVAPRATPISRPPTTTAVPLTTKITSTSPSSSIAESASTSSTRAIQTSTVSSSSANSTTESAIPSVLFPKQFRYMDVLKRFRQTLWDAMTASTAPNEMAMVTRLLSEANTPLFKEILLEALEWIPLKLAEEQDVLEEVRAQLTLVDRVSRIKKIKFAEPLTQSLLTDLQLFCQQQLTKVTDAQWRSQLQEACDRLSVLRTLFSTSLISVTLKEEAAAFKQLTPALITTATGKSLFDPKLSFLQGSKKLRAKAVWKPFLAFFNAFLSSPALKAEETALDALCQEHKKRYQNLMVTLKGQLKFVTPKPWKPQWLYGKSYQPGRSGGKRGIPITSFFHIHQAMVPAERFVCFESSTTTPTPAAFTSTVLGSTYFGAEKPQQRETTLCMDANYQQGSTGATSDGYGHFADMALNKSIQQTAYRTVKLATRYADFYVTASELYADLPRLFQQLGQAVKQSGLHPEASGTASCVLTKVFAHETDNRLCTVVAAGVGDSMVMVWEPSTHQLQVLIKPRQYDRGKQFTPVSITESLKGEMLQYAMVTVKSGAFVIRCTDGIWQSLPHVSSDPLVDPGNQKRYLEYTLNVSALMPELTLFTSQFPNANAKQVREWLLQWVQKSIEKQKAFLRQEMQTIQGKIERFPQKNTGTVSDFLAWVDKTDPNYTKTIWSFLEALHIAKDSVMDARVTDFLRQLEKIHLGDDVALHVEEVRGEVLTSTPGMRV